MPTDQPPTQRGWGGARPGAGAPRRYLRLQMSPEEIKRIEKIAVIYGASVEQIAAQAILCWLDTWQDEKAPSGREAGEGSR